MVKLQARTSGKDIIISEDSFEHLLNCLANQKYIREVNGDALGSMSTDEIHSVQKESQAAIDDFWLQCMDLLHANVISSKLEDGLCETG